MVASLKELNQICQKPRYKEAGNWYVRNILRDAALPVTWLLLHTKISANGVTTISLAVALLGAAFFAFPSKGAFLAGALLLQLWYLLDHVDGQIARYRKSASLSGRFYDFLTHHIIHGVILFGLGFHLFRLSGQVLFLVWAFIACISMMIFNLLNDTKYKTFFEKIQSTEKWTVLADNGGEQRKETKSLTRRVFSFLHKSAEIHVSMNVLTLAAFFEVFFALPLDLRGLLFVYYGLTAPFIAVTKASYLILTRKIDEEFNATFRMEQSP
jgi:phosphatidylglycerophosphate synthase